MTAHNRQQQLVIWAIWSWMVVAIFACQIFLGGGVPTGRDAASSGVSPFVVLSITQIIAASAIRWLLVPKANSPGRILVLTIIGLGLSEAAEFYGLFLVAPGQPSTKLGLWLLSLASAIQFIPLYAGGPKSRPNPFRAG